MLFDSRHLPEQSHVIMRRVALLLGRDDRRRRLGNALMERVHHFSALNARQRLVSREQ